MGESFELNGFCIEMDEVVHYSESRKVWTARDTACCRGNSAMNVSHHVKMKSAFNVWTRVSSPYAYTETKVDTLWILNISTHVLNKITQLMAVFFSV